MRYIVADIHGCYNEFMELLHAIGFSSQDELFVLGDCMDRGPHPIAVIQQLISMPNARYVLGNHDAMMLSVLRCLTAEITAESIDTLKNQEQVSQIYSLWMNNGGEVTLGQFAALPQQQQEEILCYLKQASTFEAVQHNDALYIMVHGGIDQFDPTKELEEYDPQDFLWCRANYRRRYYASDRIHLVTGHTPTPLIRKDKQPLIFQENGHLALDCGCVFGGQLAAYCLETGQTVYVNSQQEGVLNP